jgi:hypothetical protein
MRKVIPKYEEEIGAISTVWFRGRECEVRVTKKGLSNVATSIDSLTWQV